MFPKLDVILPESKAPVYVIEAYVKWIVESAMCALGSIDVISMPLIRFTLVILLDPMSKFYKIFTLSLPVVDTI